MRRILSVKGPSLWFAILLIAGGNLFPSILESSGVNRIFEIIQKGGPASLKDTVMREKDDLVIIQGLILAIAKNKPAMVEVLIEKVPDFGILLDGEFAIGATATFDPGGETVLHCAARNARVSMVKLLLNKRAPVNKPDIKGRSPLDAVNDRLRELEESGEDETKEKMRAKAGEAKVIEKLMDIAQILEEAGGQSLKGSDWTMVLVIVVVVFGLSGGLVFFLLQRTAKLQAAELAEKKKEEKAKEAAGKGNWLTEARKAASRLAGEHWIKDCHQKTGGSLEGVSEDVKQVNDHVTEEFFPQIASFVYSFTHEKNKLSLGILVDHGDKAIHLEPIPSDGGWHQLPELKGAVVRLEKQKEARTAFGSYAKLLQLEVQFDSGGKQIEGYTLKREDSGWKCTEPDFLELDLTFDDRGRLNTAKGKIRSRPV